MLIYLHDRIFSDYMELGPMFVNIFHIIHKQVRTGNWGQLIVAYFNTTIL